MKFKSPVYSEASGSIAGITYSHNRGGMYTRQRVIPTDPGSAFQVAIRGFVASLTSLWLSTLTAAQRAAWDLYAESVELPDTLGEPRNVGGLGMYVRSNVPRLQAGIPRVDDGPVIFNLGDFTNPSFGSFAAATTDFDVTFTNGDDWANEDDSAMLIYGSRHKNASVNFFKGPYRYADKIDGDSVTPPTSPATITNPFTIVAGSRTFVYMRISRADGRLSAPFRGSGTGA